MKMRKIVTLMIMATAITVNAQKAYVGNKFFDNWYLGLNGGVITPAANAPFFKSMRPAMGLEVGKQITPVFGVSVTRMTAVNTSPSKTAFDALSLTTEGKFNLNNLFAGYLGSPRLFEVEAVAGIGWGHDFVANGWDNSYMVTRFGTDMHFNVGEAKAWSVNLKPAVVYRMEGAQAHKLNVNNAGVEILAGVTYHFPGSNGKHYMTRQKAYDQAEVDYLNERVNYLRQQTAEKEQRLMQSRQQVRELQEQVISYQNEPKEVLVETIVTNTQSMESVITFHQGKYAIGNDQLPNVERIATYMKGHPKSKVMVKGYASPEGNEDFNNRLAQKRADAVKSLLVKKYKISAERITAEGQGIGDMFSEPDWNRVSIATLNEAE